MKEKCCDEGGEKECVHQKPSSGKGLPPEAREKLMPGPRSGRGVGMAINFWREMMCGSIHKDGCLLDRKMLYGSKGMRAVETYGCRQIVGRSPQILCTNIQSRNSEATSRWHGGYGSLKVLSVISSSTAGNGGAWQNELILWTTS